MVVRAIRRHGLTLLLATLAAVGASLVWAYVVPSSAVGCPFECWEEEDEAHRDETIFEDEEEERHEEETNRTLRINLKVPGAVQVHDRDGYLENSWCEGNFPNSYCGLSIPLGHSILLTPRPPLGSVFIGWEGICSGTDPCEVTMNGDREVTANFVDQAPPLPPTIVTPVKGDFIRQPPESGVVVRFDASDSGTVHFLCRLDTSDYRPCSSLWTTRRLKAGPHTVRVRARDGMGNTSTPTTRRFTIVN